MLLELMRAELIEVLVVQGAIDETLDVFEEPCHGLCSFFKMLKSISAAALSPQLFGN